jgi:hypothetical protein
LRAGCEAGGREDAGAGWGVEGILPARAWDAWASDAALDCDAARVCSSAAIEAEDDGGDAVEHVAVVGDEDERAGVFEQALFEDLEGGDVEVVGGLVEQEDVGGFEHEFGDEDAGALAAAEPFDGLVELLAGEEEFGGVAGDVDDPALIDDGVGVGRERAAEGDAFVELAGLGEVDGA